MRAVVAPTPGGPEVLEVVDREVPPHGPGDLLVRVHATALNRADLMQREGDYPVPEGATDVMGLELAGVVAEVGDDVVGWRVGDAVCAVVTAGGHAEYCVVPATHALAVPRGMAMTDAAAIPEVFTTAWDMVMTRGRLATGETLLVHGGSSGVGTAAVQLAVRAGCRVAATASTQAKRDAAAALGAEVVIDYTTTDFVPVVRDATGGRGVDVVLDVVGAPYLQRNLDALAVEGRLVLVGLQGGTRAELDMGRVLTRRLTVLGATLRARSDQAKAVVAQSVRAHVMPGLEHPAGLRPVVHTVLDLDDVAQAHRVLEAGDHVGKVVLRVD